MKNIKKLLLIPVIAIMCTFIRIDSVFAVDYYFSIGTRSISQNGTFQFKMSAKGTFYVDCGAGGTLSGTGVSGGTITKSNTTEYTYTCTYSSAGTKTIQFGGTATNYNTSITKTAISFYTSAANAALIRSISGNLSTIFPYISGNAADGAQPRFYQTFYHGAYITSIPDTLFSGYTVASTRMFYQTFQDCTALRSIPADLFKNITTSAGHLFDSTFRGTRLTSIPANLFNFGGNNVSGQEYMFSTTFKDCTGLTSIPENLFQRVTSGANRLFMGTFEGCTGLTSIPANLFSNITTSSIFLFCNTFYGCTGLTSIPANLFNFGGNNVSGQESMFKTTFYGCTGLTSIPENLFSKITSAGTYMFFQTFQGCNKIAGWIPPSTFAGLITNGHPTATRMWYYTFSGTQLITSCPTGTTKYTTGYEGTNAETTWNGKVSCNPITYSVSYACGAGTGTAPSQTTVKYNSLFTPAANSCAVPTGYTGFAGWLVSGTADIKPSGTAFTWTYTAAKTLTAQFTPATYSVTYECGSGTGTAPSGTTVTYNTSFTPATNTCTIPTGYHFTGWLVSGTNTTVSSAFTWTYTAAKTLTAQYVLNTISITWDGSSGTPSACTYGSTFTPPTPAPRTGYIFNGWKVKTVNP